MDIFKRIKKWLCLKCCCDGDNAKQETTTSHVTVDDASFIILESSAPVNLRTYSDDVNCAGWFDVSEEEPRKRIVLRHINKGDAVVFYEKYNDKLNKGLFIVTSFDYGEGDIPGSAPRALYGRTYIDGTYYSNWAPGSGYFYEPSERELEEFFAKEPMNSKTNSLYYFREYPELMNKFRKYRFNE